MTRDKADRQGRFRDWRKAARGAAMALTGLTFVGLMGAGVAGLHIRANAEAPPDANPSVTVTSRAVRFEDGYTVAERFAGRLEPARQTQLAFERAGLVIKVLFDEGDRIEAGTVVARLDTAQLEARRAQLNAQKRELQARLDLAKVTLTRQKSLKSKGWQSVQRFDEARFSVAELTAAIARIDASIRSVDIDLGKSEIRAPFAGTMAARSIDEGAIISAGTAILELLEADARQVRVGVSVAAAATLSTDRIYSLQSGDRTYQGRLISKRPDLQTGTRTVTALFEARDAKDVPFGDIVELVLERRIAAKGAWLPVTALSEGRKGLWTVLTVVERGGEPAIAREAVEVLHVEARRVFVRGTLVPDARVVLDGSNRVIPGQRVALATPETNR
ncbi:MAG: efflux RND transporter periplasmic adaptor subunit [Methyloligellaceae bacterium]